MDYKKLIKKRETRVRILRLLSFIPDTPMLKFQYRVKTGHKLNLKDPKRFTEKLQWYKLYYHNPLMIQCVDKSFLQLTTGYEIFKYFVEAIYVT